MMQLPVMLEGIQTIYRPGIKISNNLLYFLHTSKKMEATKLNFV